MGKVFFTSDLHFGHELLTQALRKMSAKESDELIIENWNSIVTKHDKVYVLGDLTMEKHSNLCLLKQLRGDITVVGGNHDIQKCCKAITGMNIPVMGVLKYKGFLCTHIPIHPLFLKECRGNIHGHIHVPDSEHDYDMTLPAGSDKYYNVNCEFHDYKPVEFQEIESYFKQLSEMNI
jgi:calcineurin-like phosphoesterase family protein